MKKIILTFSVFAILCLPLFSQIVNIPDTNFLNALIDLGLDINDDQQISYAECESITSLNVSVKQISDLTGIEAFVNLDSLDCNNNYLTALDVSNNTALTSLICYTNELTSLDVSENLSLAKLSCSVNQLTSLDVSTNVELTSLGVGVNDLLNLDVSNNTSLELLYCNGNQLEVLDVSSNTALERLGCYDNQLVSLDLSNNSALTRLLCFGNQIASLDVSNNTVLSEIDCFENHLTSLDLSDNVALTALDANNNQLTSLDLSNNTAITYLYVSTNQLSSLNVSENSAIVELFCNDNLLTNLDVSGNIDLEYLGCSDNQMEVLDVSNNTAIEYLDLSLMPTLNMVCIWEFPVPSEIELDTTGSPNIYFTVECSDNEPPLLSATDTSYLPEEIEVSSSEDGIVYLVPENTEKEIATIREASLDSMVVEANVPVNIPLGDLSNGIYWLYGRDLIGNISEPLSFQILGVTIENSWAESVKVFPVPSKEYLTIETNQNHVSIEIFSLKGQKIASMKVEGDSQQIDISYLQEGIYFVTIRLKDFVSTRKIIKL